MFLDLDFMLCQQHVGNTISDLVDVGTVGTHHLALLHMSLVNHCRLVLEICQMASTSSYLQQDIVHQLEEILIFFCIFGHLGREGIDAKL